MGYGLRWFIAEDDGTVTRVPAATCERWFDGEVLPAARAGRDLKLLEVVVNVDHHHMVGVLRILPFRQGVREDGRLDVSAATRLAMKHPVEETRLARRRSGSRTERGARGAHAEKKPVAVKALHRSRKRNVAGPREALRPPREGSGGLFRRDSDGSSFGIA